MCMLFGYGFPYASAMTAYAVGESCAMVVVPPPEGSTERAAYDLVAEEFGAGWTGPLLVTAEYDGAEDAAAGATDEAPADVDNGNFGDDLDTGGDDGFDGGVGPCRDDFGADRLFTAATFAEEEIDTGGNAAFDDITTWVTDVVDALGYLGVAFLVKAGMWPLGFWLVPAYGSVVAPVGAVFALLTKLGVYTVLRLWSVMFGVDAGCSTRATTAATHRTRRCSSWRTHRAAGPASARQRGSGSR